MENFPTSLFMGFELTNLNNLRILRAGLHQYLDAQPAVPIPSRFSVLPAPNAEQLQTCKIVKHIMEKSPLLTSIINSFLNRSNLPESILAGGRDLRYYVDSGVLDPKGNWYLLAELAWKERISLHSKAHRLAGEIPRILKARADALKELGIAIMVGDPRGEKTSPAESVKQTEILGPAERRITIKIDLTRRNPFDANSSPLHMRVYEAVSSTKQDTELPRPSKRARKSPSIEAPNPASDTPTAPENAVIANNASEMATFRRKLLAEVRAETEEDASPTIPPQILSTPAQIEEAKCDTEMTTFKKRKLAEVNAEIEDEQFGSVNPLKAPVHPDSENVETTRVLADKKKDYSVPLPPHPLPPPAAENVA